MKRALLILSVFLSACGGGQDALPATEAGAATVEPLKEAPITEPAATAGATQSEWELAQAEVARLRNLLDSYSDGHAGLTTALEQTSANADWCNGLIAGINDFEYIEDTESANILKDLKQAQGCP